MKPLFAMCLVIAHFSISLLAPLSAAKGEPIGSIGDGNTLRQQGQLVSVQLVLGEPVRIFVVGREEAKLDLQNLSLTVRRLDPYPSKVLSLDRHDNYFAITEPVDVKTPMILEVTTKIKNKTETLQFKIENKLQ